MQSARTQFCFSMWFWAEMTSCHISIWMNNWCWGSLQISINGSIFWAVLHLVHSFQIFPLERTALFHLWKISQREILLIVVTIFEKHKQSRVWPLTSLKYVWWVVHCMIQELSTRPKSVQKNSSVTSTLSQEKYKQYEKWSNNSWQSLWSNLCWELPVMFKIFS